MTHLFTGSCLNFIPGNYVFILCLSGGEFVEFIWGFPLIVTIKNKIQHVRQQKFLKEIISRFPHHHGKVNLKNKVELDGFVQR